MLPASMIPAQQPELQLKSGKVIHAVGVVSDNDCGKETVAKRQGVEGDVLR